MMLFFHPQQQQTAVPKDSGLNLNYQSFATKSSAVNVPSLAF